MKLWSTHFLLATALCVACVGWFVDHRHQRVKLAKNQAHLQQSRESLENRLSLTFNIEHHIKNAERNALNYERTQVSQEFALAYIRWNAFRDIYLIFENREGIAAFNGTTYGNAGTPPGLTRRSLEILECDDVDAFFVLASEPMDEFWATNPEKLKYENGPHKRGHPDYDSFRQFIVDSLKPEFDIPESTGRCAIMPSPTGIIINLCSQ